MANLPTRNNNPGDLKSPSTGEFLTFNDPNEGFNALKNDLQLKISGKSNTGVTPDSDLLHFSSKYAPNSDGNDSIGYANKLATKLGVPVNTPIKNLSNRLDDFASAIASNEGFQGGGQKSKQDKLKENIDAMERQGASREVIQSYIDGLGQNKGFNPSPYSSGEVSLGTGIPQDKPPGIIQGAIQHAASPITGGISSLVAAGNGLVGNKEGYDKIENQGIDYGFFGKQKPIGAGFDVTKGLFDAKNQGPLLDVLDKGVTGATDILTAQSLYGGAKSLLGLGKNAFQSGTALGTEQAQNAISKLAGEDVSNLTQAEIQNTLSHALENPNMEPSVRSILEQGLKEATQGALKEAGVGATQGWSSAHPLISAGLKLGTKGLGGVLSGLGLLKLIESVGSGNSEGVSNALKGGAGGLINSVNNLK